MNRMSNELTKELLESYKSSFLSEPRFRIAQNACTKDNPFNALIPCELEQTHSHVFNHKVRQEGRPVTNQGDSGRCWVFAAMNAARQAFSEEYNVEQFEFSQNFLFFWDKVERMNYLLNAYVETAEVGEPADGRLVNHLTFNPTEDGGQWRMLVNLIVKHGLVPRCCFPDAWSSTNSETPLNYMLNAKMRQNCAELRQLVATDPSQEDVTFTIRLMMEEIYNIVSVCLGTPPSEFTWEYYDNDNEYHKVGPISPKKFYKKFVKPYYNFEDKLVLTNDPRPWNPYDLLYTVQYLGNVVGGKKTIYVNQPIEKLKEAAMRSIKDNEAVWFGCDVHKFSNARDRGCMLDLNIHDTELVFGTKIALSMSKADRITYNASAMDHSMIITALTEENGETTKWRVENSWGEEYGESGYLVMTDDWFSEYVFLVVVDKKYVPREIFDILKTEPKVLPAWDPMGTLAT